jgi:hypothetical protein
MKLSGCTENQSASMGFLHVHHIEIEHPDNGNPGNLDRTPGSSMCDYSSIKRVPSFFK